jgi:hypothetical protein
MARTFRFSLPINGLDSFEAELRPELWNGFPVPLVAHDYAIQIAEAVGEAAPEPYEGLRPYDGLAWQILTACPKCGGTDFRVEQLTWNRQTYDAATDEWGTSSYEYEEDKPLRALCLECDDDVDCTHVLQRGGVTTFYREPDWDALELDDEGAPRVDAPVARSSELVASFLIPADWPRCACGAPVMEGHLTCGRVECDEAGARARRDAEFRMNEVRRG